MLLLLLLGVLGTKGFILLILVGIFLLYRYVTKNNDFFKKQGLPFEKPIFLLGNQWRIFFQKNINLFEYYDIYYKIAKPFGIGGIFETTKPGYIIADEEIIKNITIKDFEHFQNHTPFTGPTDIFSKTLFALQDNKWREVRSTLSPAFTGNKMRYMYELIEKCSINLEKHIEKKLEGKKDNLVKYDVKELFSRFTNDAIATSAFGMDVNSINDNKHEFLMMGTDLVDFTSGLRWLKVPLSFLSPKLMKVFFKGGLFPEKPLNFFRKIFLDNINSRRNNGIIRPDMIHLMIEAVKEAKEKHQKEELTDEEMLAQAIIFFFAGFNSVADTLSFLFHHLGANPDVQEKLYKEIAETLEDNNNVINYEILMKMPYMEMVLNESQRMQPVFPFTDRECTKKYVIPAKGNRPEVTINPGEMIFILPYSYHHDPENFPNPEKFDPERFSEENKKNINQNLFMPFGIGPRQCIGNRFAKMEIKLVVFHLLKKFEITFIEETQHPLKLLPTGNGTNPENGFWLGLKAR